MNLETVVGIGICRRIHRVELTLWFSRRMLKPQAPCARYRYRLVVSFVAMYLAYRGCLRLARGIHHLCNHGKAHLLLRPPGNMHITILFGRIGSWMRMVHNKRSINGGPVFIRLTKCFFERNCARRRSRSCSQHQTERPYISSDEQFFHAPPPFATACVPAVAGGCWVAPVAVPPLRLFMDLL